MRITSNIYFLIILKYPIIKWIMAIVSIPVYIFIYILLPFVFLLIFFVQKDSVAWIGPLTIMILSYLIPYINLRNGWASKQILELENLNLTVTNKWFLFSHKKKYKLSDLDMVELEPWNVMTGQSMKLKPKYSKLVINESTALNHFYKLEEIQNLINQYKKTVANSGEQS